MQLTETIIEEAGDISFLTNYEARLALNLSSSTDDTIADLVEMLIEWSSDEIAATCNRTFAKETLKAIYREVNSGCKRLQMSHYPIEVVSSVMDRHGNILVEGTDYEVDYESGKITRLNTTWSDPSTFIYTGGYDLPAETPPALRQATLLMTREAYFATQRGDATIRMVSHKDARVMYFDPSTMVRALASGGGSGKGGSPAIRRIQDLLTAYIHIEV